MKYGAVFRIIAVLGLMLSVNLTGCGSASGNEIPYPDGWTVQKETEIETEKSDNLEASEEKEKSEKNETSVSENGTDSKRTEPDNYFFDLSGSMKRSPQVMLVHSAAAKAGAGHDIDYWSVDSERNLIGVDVTRTLSDQYSYGAVLDIITDTELPVNAEGVNIITTDLQSNTTGTEFGKWLVDTECTGYSFYVFGMDYNGNVDFKAYTSPTILENISVTDCSFEREFLMVAFGDNARIESFDHSFQEKLGNSLKYDVCHVSMDKDSEKETESILTLLSSRCFEDNLANITYDNTNYCYGLCEADIDASTEFTVKNTAVYKKSSNSANDNENAVKAILYAIPDTEIGSIEQIETTTLVYDQSSGIWKESNVSFEVTAKGYLDGIAAAVEDEELNEKLGGNIVEKGKAAFAVTVENTELPKGLYAVDIRIECEASGDVVTLQNFAACHSAGLEEYVAALKTECTAKEINGNTSTSKYAHIATGISVYSKLLGFENLADELLVAGAEADSEKDMITLRLVINNR